MADNGQVQIVRGTKDWFGADARWKQLVTNLIRSAFESFGFEPLETPTLETIRTLKGKYGEEGDQNIFIISGSGTDLRRSGLRFDHTVPLARFMAMNWSNVILPYRRYAIGPVYRNESTQAGRYRQFTQCDYDTVGSSSSIVDSEIPAINYRILSSLGFPEGSFSIQINDRRLLNAMVRAMGVDDPNLSLAIFRGWDKLLKASREQISQELKTAGAYDGLIELFNESTDSLMKTINAPGDQVISNVAKVFQTNEVWRALEDVNKILGNITAMGVPDWAYQVNPLLARGLDYYTGPIFETLAVGGLGSITGGGRFDNLISTLGGPDLPASGSSFGLERVLDVMEKIGLKPPEIPQADAFMTIFDFSDDDLVQASFEVASILRSSGYRVEIYTGDPVGVGKQLNIANRKGIPVALIIGSDELRQELVSVKDMFGTGAKKQFSVSRDNLAQQIASILNRD